MLSSKGTGSRPGEGKALGCLHSKSPTAAGNEAAVEKGRAPPAPSHAPCCALFFSAVFCRLPCPLCALPAHSLACSPHSATCPPTHVQSKPDAAPVPTLGGPQPPSPGDGGFMPAGEGGAAEEAPPRRRKPPKIFYATRTHSQIAQVRKGGVCMLGKEGWGEGDAAPPSCMHPRSSMCCLPLPLPTCSSPHCSHHFSHAPTLPSVVEPPCRW